MFPECSVRQTPVTMTSLAAEEDEPMGMEEDNGFAPEVRHPHMLRKPFQSCLPSFCGGYSAVHQGYSAKAIP
jgi:hypothetical protein